MVWGPLGVGLGSLGGRSGVPWGSVWGHWGLTGLSDGGSPKPYLPEYILGKVYVKGTFFFFFRNQGGDVPRLSFLILY